MKSLAIVALPRSASTLLEEICHQSLVRLGFVASAEIFNKGHNKKAGKVPHFAKNQNDKHEILKKIATKYAENHVIRDVVQCRFISDQIEWIQDRFNIIYLQRPIEEVVVCCQLHGWKTKPTSWFKYRDILDGIPSSDSFSRLKYYDFVQDNPKKLYKILKNWYPDCGNRAYMIGRFVVKRYSVFKKIAGHQKKIKKILHQFEIRV